VWTTDEGIFDNVHAVGSILSHDDDRDKKKKEKVN
jgi:hypothetical protein